jgi:hypothetical protein
MAKHIVFYVHGMGQHDTAWAEDAAGPVETLRRTSTAYAHFGDRPLDTLVEVVPVRYDEIFRAAVERWQRGAEPVAALDPDDAFGRALGVLAGASEQSFFWSHAADVVMYRCLGWYRELVRAHVIQQIAERVERAWAEEGTARCSVVAHSLGTAVAHDSLHLLGTRRWGNAASPFHPSHWRFQHVVMVANTSRLLQTPTAEAAPAYGSIVRPGPVEDAGSYCATYLNVRHSFDPVPQPRRFDPVGWRKEYSTVVVDHFRDPNVHGFSHYLRNPRVHVPILRRLTRSAAVTPAEEVREIEAFPQIDAAEPLERARAHLLDLQAVALEAGDDPAPPRLTRMLAALFTLVERYRQ